MGLAKYGSIRYADGSDIGAAVGMVDGADAVVLVVGLTSEGVKPNDEAEGHDRTSLLLPGNQNTLIAQVSAAAAKGKIPVALVVMGGGPVDISDAKKSPDVGAI